MSVEGTYELLFPFNQFEVERILGKLSSGRATSWLSRNKQTGQRVVIKEVSLADSMGHEAWRERQWTGWARIHEIRTGRAAAIYIRDYVEGTPLPRPSKIGDTITALSTIASICATLAPLHALATAHGRLKPRNIILDQSGQVVLTDPTFDPSRAASQPDDEDAANASITFDPYYISPEQIREETATPASDVYSLGCILFEQLTGKAPFRNVVPLMICYQHAMNPPPDIKSFGVHVPGDLASLVQRMLAKSPGRRPAHAMELLDLIEPFLDPAYSPAAMTGAFTFSPEDLRQSSSEHVSIRSEPLPATAEPEVETEADTEETVAETSVPPLPTPRRDKSASGTMVISRRELKRLIEEADNKKYAPGDTPILDPDERLPIPLVRQARPSGQHPMEKQTTKVPAVASDDDPKSSGATQPMSTVQAREAAIVAEARKAPADPPEDNAGKRKGLQTILVIYGIFVTLLLIAAVGVIAFLLASG